MAAILGLFSGAQYCSWRSEQGQLTAWLSSTGLAERNPEIAGQVRREPDRELARVKLARALLAEEVDPNRHVNLSSGERSAALEAGIENLELAAELAGRTFERRPASWQAAFVYGASTFLVMSRQGDPRLFTEPETWEKALEVAIDLAPEQPEPTRFMASAYLGNWSRLNSTQRAAAEQTLRSAFEVPGSFDLLIAPWLRVAPSIDQAFAVLPDRTDVWDTLRSIYEAGGDTERFLAAHERWRASLPARADQILEEAEKRLAGGDTTRAFDLLRSLQRMPPDLDLVEAFSRSLALMPRGQAGEVESRYLTTWYEWTLNLCIHRACPLAPDSLDRLVSRIRDAQPPQLALGALVAGDPRRAEIYERQSASLKTADWAPYMMVKSRWLLERDRPEEAADAVEQIAEPWDRTAAFWRLRERVATDLGDSAGALRAAQEAQRLRASPWTPETWRRSGRSAVVEIWPAEEATGLTYHCRSGAATEQPVELRMNGRVVAFELLHTGTKVNLDGELSLEPNLLEVVALTGRFAPLGEIELRGRESGAS